MIATLALAVELLAAALAPAVRPHGARVLVPADALRVMDGDTAEIHWSAVDVETVRVLGIDTAELFGSKGRHALRNRPPMTARGAEARGFGRGAFALDRRVELLRSANLDRYRRTLGYFFLDGRNYSVLVIEAGLSRETITHYGDNGLPAEADEVRKARRREAPTGRR